MRTISLPILFASAILSGVTVLADSPAPPRRALPTTWCALGTSITWYNDHVSPAFTKGYETRVMERIHFDGFLNRGVNGGCISSAIGQVVPAGLYTIEHGINDWGHRTKPGTLDDYRNDTGTGTFAGTYRKVIDAIRAANPKAVIILCTPRKGYGFGGFLPERCDAQQPNGYYLREYADIVRAIAASEHFPLCDFFAACGEQDELAALSIDVALHPNDAGYQRMADELVRTLLARFPEAPVYTGDDELHGDAPMIPIPDDPTLHPGELNPTGYLRPEPRLVLKGVDLADVAPATAEMVGLWIPGSPYEASVHHIRRNPKKGTLVCQFQVRPPDACLRCVAVEFRQHGPDVTGKILWARYILNGPEPGVDFDVPGYPGAPIANGPDALGYGIGAILFTSDGKVPAPPPAPSVGGHIQPAIDALLEGVDSISLGGGGIPGPVVCHGPMSFPLVLGKTGPGNAYDCAVVAGTFHGKGRVVYMGHPAFLHEESESTRHFLSNAIRWLGEDHAKFSDSPISPLPDPNVRIAVLDSSKAASNVRAIGYECSEISSLADVDASVDILVCNDLGRADIPALRAFVEQGGGLLAAGLGWGWRFYQPETDMASLSAKFPDNQLLAPMGLVMGGDYASRFPDGTFHAAREIPRGITAEDALALACTKDYLSRSLRKQSWKTLAILAESLPKGGTGFGVLFAAWLAQPEIATVPSKDHPVGEGPARIALIDRLERWRANPVAVHSADPAHVTYPGAVRPGAEPVTTTIPVDGEVPRWHSTGLYAPAGEALTVTLPAEDTGKGLKLRIGTSKDNLVAIGEDWRRAPVVSIEIPLDHPSLTLSSPFGGLVYVVVPEKGIAGWKGEVTIAGAIRAPWFKLGRDTAADFLRQCAETHAPQGEVEGDSFVITCETEQLRRADDPEWIAAFWDRVLEGDRVLAGLPPRRSPERICSDVQLTAGWLHNGYPLMYHIGSAGNGRLDWVLDKPGLEKGDAWGPFHEIGHNHQSGDWTPKGFGEVTVNIFSAYTVSQVCGADFRKPPFGISTPEQAKRVEKFKKTARTYEDFQRDVFLALEPYLRIAETYGWDVYKKTFAAYHAPGFRHPHTDEERWATFTTLLSDAAGADLAAVFAGWGVPVPAEALADCAARHPAAPTTLLP